MSQSWLKLIGFALMPAILMSIGGIQAFIKQPGAKLTSAIQHFAAGVVFAAVAVELLPVVIDHSKWTLSIGFILGVIFMLMIEKMSDRLAASIKTNQQLPLSLILVVGIDVFIDGLLIGVAYLANPRIGLLIAIALALEVLFLGLSTAATMAKKKTSQLTGCFIIIALALLIPLGAILGYGIVSNLSKNIHYLIIAFAMAALLYLVTEELLSEAHEVAETPLITSAFFAGFLIILLIS